MLHLLVMKINHKNQVLTRLLTRKLLHNNHFSLETLRKYFTQFMLENNLMSDTTAKYFLFFCIDFAIFRISF